MSKHVLLPMLNFLIILGVVMGGLGLFQLPSLPATPSPTPEAETASPSPTSETVINQNIKDRLDRVIEEQSDKIKDVLDELSTPRRGLVGEVQRVSAESITIKTNKATHILAIPSEVSLLKNNKTIKVEEVAVGDWATVVSYLKDDELTPEKITFSSTSLRPRPQVVSLGTITEINRTRTNLTLQNRADSETKTFILNQNTKYQDLNGDPIKATALTAEVQALIVAEETDKGNEVGIIRLLVPPTTP